MSNEKLEQDWFDKTTETEVVPKTNKLHLKKDEGDDVIKDYEYARGNLYSLIEKDKKQSTVHLTMQCHPIIHVHTKLQDNLSNM